jgi:GNAT superfamily N-acetyltransferase
MADLHLHKLSGKAIADYLEAIALLRIEVFREFPYLYDGDLDYEKEYLQTYLQSEESAAFLLFDGSKVVGASTCLPMTDEAEEVRGPFAESGYAAEHVLYLGESVLQQHYRGRGLGVEFFRLREDHACSLGKSMTAFCAVNRAEDHPLRPKAYQPLNDFWNKRGYRELTGIMARMSWLDVDRDRETEKQLQFWIKSLV